MHRHTQTTRQTQTHTNTCTQRYTLLCITSLQIADLNFLTHLLERADHQNLNGQRIACEVRMGMCEVLTKSGLSFMIKMIWEIISLPRADLSYPHNFMVNSWVFKDDKSKSDAKTNSRHRVCLFLVGNPLLAWRVPAQSPLLAHCFSACAHAHTHTHTHALSICNFLTKIGPNFSYRDGKNR